MDMDLADGGLSGRSNRTLATADVVADDKSIERALSRVAMILQKAFICWRENVYNWNVLRVDEEDDKIVVHYGLPHASLHSFPTHLSRTDSIRKALLLLFQCNEAAAFMHPLLTALIRVQEIHVRFQQVHLTITAFLEGEKGPANTDFDHQVLLVTANKSKRQWLIDITGLQFGISQAFWPLTEYKSSNFVTSIEDASPSGSMKSYIEHLAKKPGDDHIFHGIPNEIAAQLIVAMEEWESEGVELARLPMLESEYQRSEITLQIALSRRVRTYVDAQDFGPRFRAATRVQAEEDKIQAQVESSLDENLKKEPEGPRKDRMQMGRDERVEEKVDEILWDLMEKYLEEEMNRSD